MSDAYIYDAIRTPRGKGRADGSLHEVTALRLSADTLNAIKARNGTAADEVEDVIWGNVTQVGEQGGLLARSAVLLSDLPESVPGLSINRFCASGLEAVNLAANQVKGTGGGYIAGGVEMMSRVPMGSDGAAIAVDPSLAMKIYFVPQGISADIIATEFGFSRDDCDALAVESQKRAAKAWGEDRFAKSVVPVKDVNGLPILERDEHLRPQTDMQSLGALKPSFKDIGETMPGFDAVAILKYPHLEKINHVHHAGNSSGIVDGAAAVLIGSKAFGEKHGLTPRARIRATAKIGTDPTIMLTGPVPVTEKILRESGMGDLRHRPLRGQRGLRRRGAALHAGLRRRSGEGQRQRRRDRHGPSARRHRRDDPRHAPRRDGALGQGNGPRHALHRLGHGRRDDHRAGVMGVIDPTRCQLRAGSMAPEPYASELAGRSWLRLGHAAGLTQFGVNLVTVQPGGRSSFRHWHRNEDEFVMVTEGELVLLQDEGEHVMRPGDCAGWPAGDRNGHCLMNRTDLPARFLVVGSSAPGEVVTCSDVDLMVTVRDGAPAFTHRDGTPLAVERDG